MVSLVVVPSTTAMARAAMERYFAELDQRFPAGFDPGPATTEDLDADRRGVFVLAIGGGAPVGCGGVRGLGDDIAEIKRMWIDGSWRGMGLGSRLLRRLEEAARDLGYRTVRLDTNATLVEAIAMYDRSGYARIDRYNDNPYAEVFFEKQLPEQPPQGY